MHFGTAAAKAVRVLALVVCLAAGAAAAAYFGITAWADTNGALTKLSESDQSRRQQVFTLLVAATDEEGLRTDSILVATFDMAHSTVDVINVPRDTLVDTDRVEDGKKINAAYAHGIEQMRADVQSVLGYRPDKYLVLSFDGIAKMVDAIGGIDYKIPFDMSYHDASQNLSIEFKKGRQHLDGKKTVEFLRWRHNDNDAGYEDGDVGRVTKLQKFLRVLAKQALTPKHMIRLPALVHELTRSVDTDLTTAQLLWLGIQVPAFDMDRDVRMTTLIGDSAEIDINMGYYLWYYVVDETMALEQINGGLNPYTQKITDLDIVTPYTIDGAESPNWIDEMACRYVDSGLEFTMPVDERQTDDYDTYDDSDSYEDEDSYEVIYDEEDDY